MFLQLCKIGTTSDSGEKLDSHINDKDYLTCKIIRNKFSMKNMGDYHDHYSIKDVMLLADVFETFIDTCLKFYRLDPCHYFSSPGLTWGVKNDWYEVCALDTDMYLFIEKGLRGGISYIAKRYAKANNKYMKDYDPKKPSKFITYLDMSNLYGWAISGYLPYVGFKWLKNVDGFEVNSISEKSTIGYILESDLEYPDELLVLHNDSPFVPENLQFLMTCCQIIVKRLLTNMK